MLKTTFMWMCAHIVVPFYVCTVQSILKYLFMAKIQCYSIGLMNTQYFCDYKSSRASHRFPNCYLSFSTQSTRKRWVFIVAHYLSSYSYVTSQNEFTDTFPNSPMPNKLTVSHLVTIFMTGSVQDRNQSSQASMLSDHTVHSGHLQHLI